MTDAERASERMRLRVEVERALVALYLEAPESVVEDIIQRFRRYCAFCDDRAIGQFCSQCGHPTK